MAEFYARAGDLLIYTRARDIIERLIQDGERLEDAKYLANHEGEQIAFHVAIAINRYYKIEALASGVQRNPIDYADCTVYRPPYEVGDLTQALMWLRTQKKRWYGYIGVLDQALRDMSFGHVHMPKWFIEWANRKWPYCSALAARFMTKAGFNQRVRKLGLLPVRKFPPLSPEDVKILVEHWPVHPVEGEGN